MRKSFILTTSLLLLYNSILGTASFTIETNLDWMIESIGLANRLLDPVYEYKLYPGWGSEYTEDNPNKIAVIISQDPKSEILFVSKNGDEILFNPKKLKKYLKFYCKEKNSNRISIEIKNICSLMLIHEVGHIYNGDIRQFDENGPVYNLVDSTEDKIKELAADRFAALQIKNATKREGVSLDAMTVSFAVTKFCWNLSNIRMIDNFGAEASVFWDKSYSHPNLELRFLIIQNEIADDELKKDSEILIKDFINRRKNVRTKYYEKKD